MDQHSRVYSLFCRVAHTTHPARRVDAPKTEHLTSNVLMIRFLDTLSDFFGNSFDKSMEEKEKRGLGDVLMISGERI